MAIYECEKTFERIFLGALFGPHAPHFIAGWRSDFQDQVRRCQDPLYPRIWGTHVSPLFPERECPGHGLLFEACHTREAYAARLDSALWTGATAQVSPAQLWLSPRTFSLRFYSRFLRLDFTCRTLLPPRAIFTLYGLIGWSGGMTRRALYLREQIVRATWHLWLAFRMHGTEH